MLHRQTADPSASPLHHPNKRKPGACRGPRLRGSARDDNSEGCRAQIRENDPPLNQIVLEARSCGSKLEARGPRLLQRFALALDRVQQFLPRIDEGLGAVTLQIGGKLVDVDTCA